MIHSPDHVVRELARRYVSEVEALLMRMPIGSTLCIHQTFYVENNDLEFNKTSYQAMFVSHFLEGEEKCETKIQKTQYGPKTQHFPEQSSAVMSYDANGWKDPSQK